MYIFPNFQNQKKLASHSKEFTKEILKGAA
jgi:hypothetical protein